MTGIVDDLTEARRRAARVRAEWLTGVAMDEIGILDVVEGVTGPGGKPLRAVRVGELLRSRPGWGARRSGRVLAHLRRALDVPDEVPDRDLTLSWLLDNRSRRGRRYTALLDALEAQSPRESPWPGFPYHPPPEQDGA